MEFSRFSTASSNDEDFQGDHLVFAQVHHNPLPETKEEDENEDKKDIKGSYIKVV